jgi:diguanylate cyclase (GGDEF)-like protein
VAAERILIVDDDPDIRTFLELSLAMHGYEVVAATDGVEAVDLAREQRPALVLMDVMMPNLDGVEALRQLRADARTTDIPVMMVTAKVQGADKVTGLEQGADDYITKPFDPTELIARVQATLRRATEMRALSPLTGLPGNSRIELELNQRVAVGEPFALLYADLNRFKAYNDHYGFLAGDRVLKAFGDLLVAVVAELGVTGAFVGHVGGDDFVVVSPADAAAGLAEEVCTRFDGLAPSFYRDEDRTRGYVEVSDRKGEVARVGIVSVSIGIADTRRRDLVHPGGVVEVATEMKRYAKQTNQGASNWVADRRADAGDAAASEGGGPA